MLIRCYPCVNTASFYCLFLIAEVLVALHSTSEVLVQNLNLNILISLSNKLCKSLKRRPKRNWQYSTETEGYQGVSVKCQRTPRLSCWVFLFPRKSCCPFFPSLCGGFTSHLYAPIFPSLCCGEKRQQLNLLLFCEPTKVLSEFLQWPRLKNSFEDVNKIQLLRCC